MRVIIAGGGTGGHIFPGIAIAEELKRREDKTEVIFIGTEHGIEARIIPREGYPIKFLRAEGFVGVSLLRKIRLYGRCCFQLLTLTELLRRYPPNIVIGVEAMRL